MPEASLPSVLPVHGAMISRSSSFFGPIGSASRTVWIISFPVASAMRLRKCSAVPKRVSVSYAVSDIIGVISNPASVRRGSCSSVFASMQKEPHIANPTRVFSISDILSVYVCYHYILRSSNIVHTVSAISLPAVTGKTFPGRPPAFITFVPTLQAFVSAIPNGADASST